MLYCDLTSCENCDDLLVASLQKYNCYNCIHDVMWCYDLRQQWGLSTANCWLSNTCYILLSLLQTEHHIYMNRSANIFKLWLYLRGSCATGRFQKGQDGFAVSGTTMSMVPGCCRSVLTVALKCSTMKLTQTDRKTHVHACTHARTHAHTHTHTHTHTHVYIHAHNSGDYNFSKAPNQLQMSN